MVIVKKFTYKMLCALLDLLHDKNKAVNDKVSDLFLDLPVMTHLFEKTNH